MNDDRFLPADAATREIARRLYASVRAAPIISPHGHTDPQWFADNTPFANATDLLITPDHYVLRMLFSHGVALEDLGVAAAGASVAASPREAWRTFASHYYLFRGTPCKIWLDHVFAEVFGLGEKLKRNTADLFFDAINEALQTPAFRPLAILERFNVRFLATTEAALDPLAHHAKLSKQGLGNSIVTTFRPDDVIDASRDDFAANIASLGELTGENTAEWGGYLQALRQRREFFKRHGATATDHGHPSAATADLQASEAKALFARCLSGEAGAAEQELFRAQMLTEMAGMSLDDGLVMQLHPGVHRNHNRGLFERFGPDKGADIPLATNYVEGLHPLLNKFGSEPGFKLVVFTLDETTYARELAPLAGHYPCMKLGPPWWFNDSPQGMLRFRRSVTETAGFYNTAGFNDDTRALLSIPARHDLARRMDAHFLAQLVAEQHLDEDEALELMQDLTINLVCEAYNINLDTLPDAAVAE